MPHLLSETLVWCVTLLLFGMGLIGTLIPMLPGIIIIAAGCVWQGAMGRENLAWWEWTDPVDGKAYVFVSPNLWFDPTDLIARRNITSFPVQIDSEDPSYYYVDISCLQNRTDE